MRGARLARHRSNLPALIATAGIGTALAITGPLPSAAAPHQPAPVVAAQGGQPRASLAASTTLADDGGTVITLASDASKVRLTYRRAGRERARVLHLIGGALTMTLPAGASDVRARALPGAGLRASRRVPVAVTGKWPGKPSDLIGRTLRRVSDWANSPDGNRVAFQSTDPTLPGQPGATWALYVSDRPTGAVQLVTANATGAPATHNGHPAVVLQWSWLPGSDRVAFLSDATNLVPGVVDGQSRAYVKDLATGAVTLAVSVPDYPVAGMPAWSADGIHVAFPWRADCPGPIGTLPRRGVVVADLGTGQLTPVIQPPPCGSAPAEFGQIWVDGISADGSRVLVRREQVKSYGIMAVHDVATGAAIEVPSGPTTFSPDGTALLTVTMPYGDEMGESSQAIVTEFDSGRRRVVLAATGSSREGLQSASWSPDAAQITFEFRSLLGRSTFSAQDRNRRSDVYVRDLATGAMSLVSPGSGRPCPSAGLPQWSPDGRHVGFICGTAGRLMSMDRPG